MDVTLAILIDIDTAAMLLSISPRRLSRLARAGKIPFVDLGDGEFRFVAEELREWARGLSRQEASHG